MNSLTIKNLKGRPAATAVLLVLSSLLCFAVFVGSIMVNSLPLKNVWVLTLWLYPTRRQRRKNLRIWSYRAA